MMKDLLWAESQKLHRSKILWIAGFATVMVLFRGLRLKSPPPPTAGIYAPETGVIC